MDTINLRNEIPHKIEKLGRDLLLLIEQYEYSVILEKDKVLEILTTLYGFADYIKYNPTNKSDCLGLMLRSREISEVVNKEFTSGQRD
jgi:hypothetical protein